MNQKTTEIQSTLTDEQIVEIAQIVDKMIVEVGQKFKPTGIEFAAILLGRLMVFTKQVDCYDTFHQMVTEIVNMGSVDFHKDQPLQ